MKKAQLVVLDKVERGEEEGGVMVVDGGGGFGRGGGGGNQYLKYAFLDLFHYL